MELGMIGLGKMGANMVTRLAKGGHRVVAYARTPSKVEAAVAEGAVGSSSLADLVGKLSAPRVVWVMVPAGAATDETIAQLADLLDAGDIIIDGGNSNYKDTIRHAEWLRERNLHFVDVGTSGGIWGLTEGYSMMIGGEASVVEQLTPIFATLAPGPDQGWGHVGPHGSGHFVKMVHNGIEYGMMQAYAEGLDLLRRKSEFALDLHQVSTIWQHGSVVRSWLLDLIERALDENPTLEDIAAYVPDSGEGRWTVIESVELGCAIPVITLALQRRFRSRDEDPFSDKLLSAMRNQFGGHAVKRKGEA
jgi:6-phosphogluconate dehydrogenase